MNADQLKKKNLHQTVKIRPIARRWRTATNEMLPQMDDEWMIRPAPQGFIRLDNMRATGLTVTLPNDSVREYRATGHLRLACQLTLTERDILIEPIWGG